MRFLFVIFVLIYSTASQASSECRNLFQANAEQSVRAGPRPYLTQSADAGRGPVAVGTRPPELVSNNPNSSPLNSLAPIRTEQEIWNGLRARGELVNQNSIPGRDELCATACAINILQAAAVKANIAPHRNAQALFEKFVQEHVPTGGANVAETVSRLRILLNARFGESAPTISATFLGGLNQDAQYGSVVNSITLDDLKPEPNKLKLVMAGLLDENGGVVFQHAQIIESVDGTVVKIIDPNAPEVEISADVRGTMMVNFAAVPRIFFRNNQLSGIDSMIPLSVITIDVGERTIH